MEMNVRIESRSPLTMRNPNVATVSVATTKPWNDDLSSTCVITGPARGAIWRAMKSERVRCSARGHYMAATAVETSRPACGTWDDAMSFL